MCSTWLLLFKPGEEEEVKRKEREEPCFSIFTPHGGSKWSESTFPCSHRLDVSIYVGFGGERS